jgi:predicted nucleic acid-binding Zn ribbon protein
MKRIMSKTTFRLKGKGWFSDPPKKPEGEERDG